MTLRIITCILAAISLAGCATQQPVMLDSGFIRNETDNQISNIEIRFEPTGRIAKLNILPPRKSLDLGFPRQELEANRCVVTWEDATRQRRRVELPLPKHPKGDSTRAGLSLVYTFHADGTLTVQLDR